jgi:hypothetical protein
MNEKGSIAKITRRKLVYYRRIAKKSWFTVYYLTVIYMWVPIGQAIYY